VLFLFLFFHMISFPADPAYGTVKRLAVTAFFLRPTPEPAL